MHRRDFLKTGLTGALMYSCSGLTALLPRAASAATVNFTVTASAVTKTLIDSTATTPSTLLTWQFVAATPGPGALASGLAVTQGDTVNVTLTNTLTVPVKFAVAGTTISGPVCAPQQTVSFSFTAPAAGSYYYHDTQNGDLGRAMGLSGPLVVMPPGGGNALYPGGPAFDRQYTLVLNEFDTNINAAVAAGQTPSLANYEPNYFFANGLSYPQTETDTDTRIAMALNEDVAIRFINTGLIQNPMHFHGYHVDVATRNRTPETAVIRKDTVNVRVGECVDVILAVDQTGIYQIHSHFLPAVTANGVYANGAMIMMEAV
jgi:FtsP/CotA-like multicopper oxidase with cupredoxin domain